MANIQHPRMQNNNRRRMLSYVDPTTGQQQIVAEGTPLPAGACPMVVNDPNDTQNCLNNNPANCAVLGEWRQYVEGTICAIPKGVRDKIDNRNLVWQPGSLYSSRAVEGTTKFFKSDDKKSPGIINVASKQLEADFCFVCFAIRLGSAIGTSLGELDYFGIADTPPATTGANIITSNLDKILKNAELEVRINDKVAFKEITGNNFNQIYADQIGTWKVPIPFVIPPLKNLDVDITLASGVSIPANLAAHIELLGLITRSNYMDV